MHFRIIEFPDRGLVVGGASWMECYVHWNLKGPVSSQCHVLPQEIASLIKDQKNHQLIPEGLNKDGYFRHWGGGPQL